MFFPLKKLASKPQHILTFRQRLFNDDSAPTVQRPGVYSAAYGTVHYKEPLKSFEIRVGHSPSFGLPSVAILPWLCRKRRKAIFTHTCLMMSHSMSRSPANTYIHPVLAWCWASVYDAGPTPRQHWMNVSCFPGMTGRAWGSRWLTVLRTRQTITLVQPVSCC